MLNNHQALVNFNLSFRSPGQSIFAVRPLPLLKKKSIKRNISFFSVQMYFQDTILLPGQAATKARVNRLHVVTVFPGATRNEKNRKYHTNLAQLSHKNYLVTLHWNVSLVSDNTTTTIWFMNRRSCVQLGKEHCKRRVELNFRKVEIAPFGTWRVKRMKSALTISLLF